jgi:hypothetical protein
MRQTPIIFLDIDGVMVTRDCFVNPEPKNSHHRMFDGRCVRALQRIIEAVPDVRIVVSSTWRLGSAEMFDRLRDHIALHGITAPVCGRTPDFRGQERGTEISHWLQHHKRIERFAILDDENDMGDELLPRLVQTDFENGLTDQHADTVIAMLSDCVCEGQSFAKGGECDHHPQCPARMP